MNRIKDFLKRHLAILLLVDAIIIAGLNLLIYPTFIKKDMGLVEVPVATISIPSGAQVTPEMLTEILISSDTLPSNVEINKNNIIGMYVKEEHTIDASMFFSKESLSTKKDRMGEIFYKLNDNEYAYTMSISGISNADSKLKVGQYIDVMYQEMVTVSEQENEDTKNRKEETTSLKLLNGILDNNVRILYLSKADDKTTITVAINEEELSYYLTATKMGELLPVLSSYATTPEHTSEVYDEAMTRQYLDTKSVSYKVAPELPEEELIDVTEEVENNEAK